MATLADIHYLWSKINDDKRDDWNSLPSHSVDVAASAYVLWKSVIPEARRKHWERLLGLSSEETAVFVAFIAAIHDLGKSTASFEGQASAAEQRDRLKKGLALPFPLMVAGKQVFRHGTASTVLLPEILRALWPELDETNVAERYAAITGAHHGKVASTSDYSSVRKGPSARGTGRWDELRNELVIWLRETIGFNLTRFPLYRPSYADALWLAGLISVADWIGSNEDYFPYQRPDSDKEYRVGFDSSLKNAKRALGALRWYEQPLGIKASTFCDAFPVFEPNATQVATEAAAQEMSGPGILIVEAQTGSGKTEAALFVAEHAREKWGTRGMYVAMPTMATSDQLHDRVRTFYEGHNTNRQFVNLQLLHGHAALSAELDLLTRINLSEIPDEWTPEVREVVEKGDEARVRGAAWFKGRGKGLLAPAGVGTIDQALLGVLTVRHHFVRLFGLSGKTIIFDEIHSYDIYMNEIFVTLLEFLGALGSPVILLSATLPRRQTQELLAAYVRGADWELPELNPAPYPRITFSDGTTGHTASRHIPDDGTVPSKRVVIEWKLGDENEIDWHGIGLELRQRLSAGGTAAIICNAVREAQHAYEVVRAMWPNEKAKTKIAELQLFHARFRFVERRYRQKNALDTFGKDAPNPRPRQVIIATQVIEQSLDLDVDILISMLCPTDLLIQRVGRLHRHTEVRDADRPISVREPTLWILAGHVDSSTGVPSFHGGSQYIYGEHILLRSWLALRTLPEEGGKSLLQVPDDIEQLIEATYDDRSAPIGMESCWQTSLTKMREQIDHDRTEATKSLIPGLFYEGGDPFTKSTIEQEIADDAPELHPAALARTRLGPPSVDVVIVSPKDLESIGWDMHEEPTRTQVIQLLGFSVSLANYGLAKHLLEERKYRPDVWAESPYLRHHRLIQTGEDGTIEIKEVKTMIALDEELGIKIWSTEKEKGNDNGVV